MKPSALPRPEARVSPEQVAAFRLARHHLAERSRPGALLRVVREMGGAQAQVLSAAQLSIWARLEDVRVEDIASAVETDRTLARAWCMRATVHLVPSSELAVFVRGSARRVLRDARWLLNRGFSQRRLDELLDATLAALDEPISRAEIAVRVASALGLATRSERGGGWGSQREVPCVVVDDLNFQAGWLTHLASLRGVVCSGPNPGGESTFVRADAWVPDWRDVPVERAESDLLRIYLRASGPATPADFALWSGVLVRDALEIWAREASDIAAVEVDGRAVGVLRSDLDALQSASLPRPHVRLLPNFDSFLIRHAERRHLVDAAHHTRVFRAAGWVSPVVLVNGRVAGVWSQVPRDGRMDIVVDPFSPLPASVLPGLQDEARELARFLELSEGKVRIGRPRRRRSAAAQPRTVPRGRGRARAVRSPPKARSTRTR